MNQEIEAINKIITVTNDLTHTARIRVLRYLVDLFKEQTQSEIDKIDVLLGEVKERFIPACAGNRDMKSDH
jgi:hypothetical protein